MPDFVLYDSNHPSEDCQPEVGDLLFFETGEYTPKAAICSLTFLSSYAINRLTRLLQWSNVTHVSMVVAVFRDNNGIKNCLIADTMPFSRPHLTVLECNEDKGWMGHVFRYTGPEAERVRNTAALIAYSHTVDADDKEHHSITQAACSAQKWLSFITPTECHGIHTGGEHSRFDNRYSAGHGQKYRKYNGTFCSKFFSQCYLMALRELLPDQNIFKFDTNTTCTAELFTELKAHKDFSNVAKWETDYEPCEHDLDSDIQSAKAVLEQKRIAAERLLKDNDVVMNDIATSSKVMVL